MGKRAAAVKEELPSWPADNVERRAISSLTPYASNPRLHSPQQIGQIASSIRQWGWTIPILIDEGGTIIAGHGRVMAAEKLGLTEVPVMVARGWTEAQKRAYVIADNQLTLNGEWDEPLLRLELGELEKLDFDLSLTGFDEVRLATFIGGTAGECDPEETPEPQDRPISRTGDLWVMGKHRLLCGDATNGEDVARVLGRIMVDCIFTSPPYGVGVDYCGYSDTIENLRSMLPKVARTWASSVAEGGFAVINFGDIINGREAADDADPCEYPMALEYWPAFRSAKWVLWTRRIWQKPHARVHSPWAIQSCRAASDWEHIWVWKKPGKPVTTRGEHSAFGVWDTSKEHGVDLGKEIHGAGMAVSLATRGIETHSRPSHSVLDPFLGSGTTLIAAEMTGRVCYALEIAPTYIDVAIRRWQKFTGQKAILESTTRSFEYIEQERAEKVSEHA